MRNLAGNGFSFGRSAGHSGKRGAVRNLLTGAANAPNRVSCNAPERAVSGGTEGKMAMLSNEELVDRYAECVQGYGPGYDATLAFREELLRRLSAGNSQACGDDECCTIGHPCCVATEYGALRSGSSVRISDLSKPERSDGRITERDFEIVSDGRIETDEQADARYHAILDYSVRMPSDSGEQRETRVRGEKCGPWVDMRCIECGERAGSPQSCEAQRSAGRVEAGSEQVQKVAGLGGLAGSVPHNQRNYKP